MQRAYELIPGNYYAIHTGNNIFTDAFFIGNDIQDDFRTFGLVSSSRVLGYLKGDYNHSSPNRDIYIAIRHKTKIFESLDFHATEADDDMFTALCEQFRKDRASSMERRNEEKERNERTKRDEIKKRDSAKILRDGPVVGRYYSISGGNGFINAYLICTEKDNSAKLIFGIKPPLEILRFLKANESVAIDGSIVAIRDKHSIYTRTENIAVEFKSGDFKTMRTLLMDRLKFPSDDAQRNFDIVPDDELVPTASSEGSKSDISENEPESKTIEALRNVNAILNKMRESLDDIQKQLNR